MTTPLAILDLSPFGEGQTPADGLRASIALAQHAEALGYSRYWLAEHHLNPGVAGAAPHVLLAAIAAATSRIRVGTAATIIGNYSALQVVEAAGVVAALHPGRFDLGIGRSGATSSAQTPPPAEPQDRVVDGLLLPASRPFAFDANRFVAQARLLGRTAGDADRFEQDVRDILALIEGTYLAPEGVPIHATPRRVRTSRSGCTAAPRARALSSPVGSGLPFGANYHVAPTFVLDAVAAYRAAFRPSSTLAEPYVTVSVDVLVADTDAEARRLSAGYAQWVHSIRAGNGAIPFPSPDSAWAHPLDAAGLEVVRDRLATRFVGSPENVAEQLETLRRATGADELLVTTITHDPADRERSYALLAREWGLTPTDAATASLVTVGAA